MMGGGSKEVRWCLTVIVEKFKKEREFDGKKL